jgi:hypothetical protein
MAIISLGDVALPPPLLLLLLLPVNNDVMAPM